MEGNTVLEVTPVEEFQTKELETHFVCCVDSISLKPGVYKTFCGLHVLSDQVGNGGPITCMTCQVECAFGECPNGFECESILNVT